MYLAPAIAFDPRTRRCDLVVSGRGLVLDTTALTPMLIALGTDRRAEPDDELPDTTTEGSLQSGFNPRRGWAGDAFNGDRIGSRWWLIERAKLTDETLLAAEDDGRQALQPLADAHGADLDLAASRVAQNVMLVDVMLGSERRQLRLRTA